MDSTTQSHGDMAVGRVEFSQGEKSRIRTLAYMIAHEAKCIGEFQKGNNCKRCKECLHAISKYLDEFLVAYL